MGMTLPARATLTQETSRNMACLCVACRSIVLAVSRGPGVAQRAVLEVAGDGSFTVDDVLKAMGKTEVGRSERESVLRAMRQLERAGDIVLTRDGAGRIVSGAPYVAPVPKIKAPPKPKRSVSLKQPISSLPKYTKPVVQESADHSSVAGGAPTEHG